MNTRFVGLLAVTAQLATAQCPYIVSQLGLGDFTYAPDPPSYTCVETPPQSNHWVITLSAHDLWLDCPDPIPPSCDIARLEATVSGGTAFSSCSIVVDATDLAPKDGVVALEVVLKLGQDSTTDPLIGNAQLIALSDNALDTALVIADDSAIIGNLIELYANALAGRIFVDGDVGSIYLHAPWSVVPWSAASSLATFEITGNVLGTIYVNGRIHDLDVGRSIGSLASPAAILSHATSFYGSSTNVGRIACDHFFGRFDAFALNPSYLTVERLEVRGDLHGQVFIPWGFPGSLPAVEIQQDLYGHIAVGTFLPAQTSAIFIGGNLLPSGSVDIFRWMRSGSYEPPLLDIVGDIEGAISIGDHAEYVVYSPTRPGVLGYGRLTANHNLMFFSSFSAASKILLRGPIEQDAVLNISGAFAGTIEALSTAPVLGQIIVNSDAATGTLSGGATLNLDTTPIALQPFPLYSNLSSDLEGGAIGAVPFEMHAADCLPPSNYVIKLRTIDSSPDRVHIQHYGPIRLADTGSLLIEMRPYYAPSTWTPVPFTPTVSVSPTNPRVLLIENAAFDPELQYRIRPNGYVLCDGNALLSGTDVPVAEYTYTFHVRTLLDRNMSGLIEGGDVAIQVADPIDVNGDEVADVVDLMEVIHATGG